jgi:hypothetical protein
MSITDRMPRADSPRTIPWMAGAVVAISLGVRGQTCRTNDECGPLEYCQKAVGDCNGVGVCAERPGACPAIFDPVCGCDGITYSSACVAAAAGMNVAHEAPCCPGDVDLDGEVAFPDLLAVLAAWGPYGCPPFKREDFDMSCDVGFGDLLVVLAAWGPCRP